MENINVAAIVLLIVLGIVIGIAFYYLFQRTRSMRLAKKFGPEYSAVIAETGDRRRAESKLLHREQRVEKLPIRALPPDDRLRYQESWYAIQSQFVDDPRTALSNADRLLLQVMAARGYPIDDFEQRAADISVHYPVVVQNFRAGHQIAVRSLRGQATTEEIRQAMVHYRMLFEELVGSGEVVRARTA
jgi:hypothetical protein